jgi:hypothetical protein
MRSESRFLHGLELHLQDAQGSDDQLEEEEEM